MEDFNVPTAERVALLERLQGAMGGAPPHFWAACQICDLKALEKLAEGACINPELYRGLATITFRMALHWIQSSKGSSRTSSQIPSQTTTPKTRNSFDLSSSSVDSLPVKKQNPFDLGSSPASSSPAKRQKTTDSPGGKVASSLILSRNKTAKTSAKQRDNFCCVLTGDGEIEAAHIYSHQSLKNKEEDIFGPRHIFWDHLKNFWPKEKVAAWEAELFPNGLHEIGIKRVYNFITLSPTAHRYWNRGAFALKPISVDDNNTTLKVQFFWQNRQNNTQATMSLLTTPPSTENLDRNIGAYNFGTIMLPNFCGPQPCYIKSGDFFELKTDNAEARPLPSFKLLEMQWFLTRVVGMAGAAVPYDEDWGDEGSDDAAVLGWRDEVSDDKISNLGLEEAGDDSYVFSEPDPQDSPPFLRKGRLLPDEGSKHHIEEATGDGFGDIYGGQEIM